MKEGTKDEDMAFIYLNDQGKIQIEGTKIYWGKSTRETEPYIKYTIYEDHINKLKEHITALGDQVKQIATLYNNAFRVSTAVPFSPIASLVTVGQLAATQTDAEVSRINSALAQIDPAAAKSTKIFGE